MVYEVEAIMRQKRETVNAVTLLMYKSNIDGKKVSKEFLSHVELSEFKYESVDELTDITGKEKDSIHVLVKWLGLPDKHDYTWHPIEDLCQDIPDRVELINYCYKKTRSLSQKIQHLAWKTQSPRFLKPWGGGELPYPSYWKNWLMLD